MFVTAFFYLVWKGIPAMASFARDIISKITEEQTKQVANITESLKVFMGTLSEENRKYHDESLRLHEENLQMHSDTNRKIDEYINKKKHDK